MLTQNRDDATVRDESPRQALAIRTGRYLLVWVGHHAPSDVPASISARVTLTVVDREIIATRLLPRVQCSRVTAQLVREARSDNSGWCISPWTSKIAGGFGGDVVTLRANAFSSTLRDQRVDRRWTGRGRTAPQSVPVVCGYDSSLTSSRHG